MNGRTHYWSNDVVYMRWMSEGKVIRVAKVVAGECCAFYPAADTQHYSFEFVVDDTSTKPSKLFLIRKDLEDEVLLDLVSGRDTRDILRKFQPSPLGEERDGDPRFSYYYAKAGSEESGIDYHQHGTFHIAPDFEERKAA